MGVYFAPKYGIVLILFVIVLLPPTSFGFVRTHSRAGLDLGLHVTAGADARHCGRVLMFVAGHAVHGWRWYPGPADLDTGQGRMVLVVVSHWRQHIVERANGGRVRRTLVVMHGGRADRRHHRFDVRFVHVHGPSDVFLNLNNNNITLDSMLGLDQYTFLTR